MIFNMEQRTDFHFIWSPTNFFISNRHSDKLNYLLENILKKLLLAYKCLIIKKEYNLFDKFSNNFISDNRIFRTVEDSNVVNKSFQ